MIELPSPYPKELQHEAPILQWDIDKEIKIRNKKVSTKNDFLQLLKTRRTRREFKSVHLNDVGELLYLSNRTLFRENSSGLTTEKRPVISAGGLHCVEILVSPANDSYLYRYNSISHSFERLTSYSTSKIRQVINQFFPTGKHASAIWYVGDITKASGKYEHPESLIWRDAGAILSTHSLVSEHLNLAFSPLGVTLQAHAEKLSNERILMCLGIALIGSRV